MNVAKSTLFVLLVPLAGGLLVARDPGPSTVALLLVVVVVVVVVVWAAARSYYFAFYVIERRLDPQFRFSGLISAPCRVVRHGRR